MGPSATPPDPLNPLDPVSQRRQGEDLVINRVSSAPAPPAAPEGFRTRPSAEWFDATPPALAAGGVQRGPSDGMQRGPSDGVQRSPSMPCKVPRRQRKELVAELEQVVRKQEKVS
jgi:hypothetical protein